MLARLLFGAVYLAGLLFAFSLSKASSRCSRIEEDASRTPTDEELAEMWDRLLADYFGDEQ